MPAHISFGDRIIQIGGYVAIRLGGGISTRKIKYKGKILWFNVDINIKAKKNMLGIGPLRGTSIAQKGYSFSDIADMTRKLAEERQCVVSDYDAYRSIIEYWNPGRPAWSVSAEPQGVQPGHFRTTRLGSHRGGSSALDAFEGGHQAPGRSKNFSSTNALNTVPVSDGEWTSCLAAGCPIDRVIKEMFEVNQGIQLMIIRGGDISRSEDRFKLKRIEMGNGKIWDILWSNHDA